MSDSDAETETTFVVSLTDLIGWSLAVEQVIYDVLHDTWKVTMLDHLDELRVSLKKPLDGHLEGRS